MGSRASGGWRVSQRIRKAFVFFLRRLDAQKVLYSASAQELFEDPRINPSGRTPTLEGLQITSILVRARAERDVLDREAAVEVFRATEKLEAEGAFVEFFPGQKLENPDGVVSFAKYEEDKSGRLFYIFPEEFPEVYQKRDTEKAESAERALRDIIGVLANGVER